MGVKVWSWEIKVGEIKVCKRVLGVMFIVVFYLLIKV